MYLKIRIRLQESHSPAIIFLAGFPENKMTFSDIKTEWTGKPRSFIHIPHPVLVLHGTWQHWWRTMTYLTPCLYFMALMSWYMAALMKDHDLPDSLLVLHGFDVVVHGGTDEAPWLTWHPACTSWLWCRGTWRHWWSTMTYLTPCLYFMALMSWYMAALMKDNDLPDSSIVLHGFDVVVHGGTDEGPWPTWLPACTSWLWCRGTWRHWWRTMTYLTPCLYFMALISWYCTWRRWWRTLTYLTPCLYFMALMSWYMAALMKEHHLPDSLLVLHGFDVVVHGGTDEGPWLTWLPACTPWLWCRGTWQHWWRTMTYLTPCLYFMALMSWYMAALMMVSMGAIMPYFSGEFSITRASVTLGSNIMALGVTSSTPLTTPWRWRK